MQQTALCAHKYMNVLYNRLTQQQQGEGRLEFMDKLDSAGKQDSLLEFDAGQSGSNHFLNDLSKSSLQFFCAVGIICLSHKVDAWMREREREPKLL